MSLETKSPKDLSIIQHTSSRPRRSFRVLDIARAGGIPLGSIPITDHKNLRQLRIKTQTMCWTNTMEARRSRQCMLVLRCQCTTHLRCVSVMILGHILHPGLFNQDQYHLQFTSPTIMDPFQRWTLCQRWASALRDHHPQDLRRQCSRHRQKTRIIAAVAASNAYLGLSIALRMEPDQQEFPTLLPSEILHSTIQEVCGVAQQCQTNCQGS